MSIEVNVTKQLNNYPLEVAFTSADGRIGILGASGCGKSMTLKCIAGIETPDTGRIVVNGKVLFDAEYHINVRPQERNIGYLFQNYALFPTMTVKENIMVGLVNKHVDHIDGKQNRWTRICTSVVNSLSNLKIQQNKNDKNNDKNDEKKNSEIVAALMEKLSISELANQYPDQLSGGQQQRVALARILAYEPDVILLDEPFSALDSFLKENLMRELKAILKDYKGQVIVVSHSRDEIYSLCNTLLIMDKGLVLRQGDTKEVFANPEIFEAAKLTGCKNISSIEKIDDHTVYANDWNLTLYTKEKVLDMHKYIGIRAHDLVPMFDDMNQKVKTEKNGFINTIQMDNLKMEHKANLYEVTLVDQSEAPFEMWYMLQPEDSSGMLWWKVAKPVNDTIYSLGIMMKINVPEDKLILLK